MPNFREKVSLPRLTRFPLDPWVRRGVALALVLLVLAPAFLALRAFLGPTSQPVQVPAWGWVHWAEWDHTVFLHPNTVYGTTELGPGHTYYDTLVKGIEARFSYNFATDGPADIEGWYEVITTLAAGDLPGERVLMVPRTEFTGDQDSRAGFQLTIPVDRQLFRDRVQEILAETGVQTRVNSTVTYAAHIEVAARGDPGSAQAVLEPTLRVPLNQETFSITGDRALQDHGVVYRREVQPVPGVWAQRRNWLAATALLALLPPAFLAATRPGPAEADPLARQARSLHRKYRKRIAQAGPGPAVLPGGEVVAVASMDDLARVSEELLKPIIYANGDGQQGAHLFYIVDGATRYQYRLAADGPPAAPPEPPAAPPPTDPPPDPPVAPEAEAAPVAQLESMVAVDSMEELSRLSGELGRPIIYAGFDGHSQAHLYCLDHGATRYQYRLTVLG